MGAQELYIRVPAIVTGAGGITRSVVRDPGLAAVGALEERVVAGAVVAVGRGQDATAGLLPGARFGRVRHAVPRQEAQAVAGRPAVRRRVREVGLAAEVQRRRALVDRRRHLLPRRRRLRDDADGPRHRREVRAQLLDAQRLRRHPVKAREDEVVAEASAERRGVNRPLARQLAGISECVPRRRAT